MFVATTHHVTSCDMYRNNFYPNDDVTIVSYKQLSYFYTVCII